MSHENVVGVIGAGTMGAGIAQTFASAGSGVAMVDISADAIRRGADSIAASLDRVVKRGKLSADDKDQVLARIKGSTDYEALRTADLIIEAATENPELKLRVIRQVDALAKPEALIASNTSSISITALAAVVSRPDRFLGMHFFNPAPIMALVELVRGLQTSDATIEQAAAIVRRIGKTPILVKSSPGFVVNRLLAPMINEAILALQDGLASAADIDEGMKLGCNHPIGPLALADMVGLDVLLAIMNVLHAEFGDPKYRPAPLLKEMVAANYLGRKTSRGFYTYQ
jgi:3-hydroxybutyryl-CoA dehydrogenase